MIAEKTIKRTSLFGVGDHVMLLPDYDKKNSPWEDYRKFFEAEPIVVLEVVIKDGYHPYRFEYFCENTLGERMFVSEHMLNILSEHSDSKVSVDEYVKKESEYDVGDTAFYRSKKGTVVKVDVLYDEDALPYFSYLAEFEDRTRKRLK